jgi:hypothetical protein
MSSSRENSSRAYIYGGGFSRTETTAAGPRPSWKMMGMTNLAHFHKNAKILT